MLGNRKRSEADAQMIDSDTQEKINDRDKFLT